MKQQILELKKKLLLVELKSDKPIIEHRRKYHTMDLIGKLTDITESQFDLFGIERDNDKEKYLDYTNETYSIYSPKESFFSYLGSKEIYFENPLGEYPNQLNTGLEYGMEYISKQANWEEAQEKVWTLSNCYLFEII